VRIIAFKKLREFWERPGFEKSESSLRAWYQEVKRANFSSPNEIKAQFQSASILGNGRVVFNIKGNSIRLVVAFHFEQKIAFIRFIGTHGEYDKIDAKKI